MKLPKQTKAVEPRMYNPKAVSAENKPFYKTLPKLLWKATLGAFKALK